MQRKEQDGITWLEFELLADVPQLTHGIFLRHGGVSKGVYSSLNVLRGKGDPPAHVEENRTRILQTLNLSQMVSARQIHETHIKHVETFQEEFSNCDGLITLKKERGLLIAHADCQAALFYDPVHEAIANVHAGWRGQVKNIYEKTIKKMGQTCGTDPADLLVCISPSLGPQNAEFKNYKEELPASFWPFQIKPLYFDLWEIARHQLITAGIRPQHIEIAQIDTFAHPEDFFSYRRETKAGRRDKITGCHATVIALRE